MLAGMDKKYLPMSKFVKKKTLNTRSLLTKTNFCAETSLLEEVSCIQKTKSKVFLIIDLILILGSLLSVFFIVGYTQPFAIAPLNDGDSLIFVLPKIDYLLLDNNLKFDSPTTIFINDKGINLEPGRYYMKIDSTESSEIREIKIEVDIVLKLKRLDDGFVGAFNVGNSALKVETYKVGTLINSSLVYSAGGNG